MNFGPYRKNAYGEVLRSNPEYAKYLINVNKRDNQKARFAHWAGAFVVETFFTEDEEQEEEVVREDHQVSEGRSRFRFRRKTSAERARAKQEDGEPGTDSDGVPIRRAYSEEETADVLLNQLMTGDWDAVGQMAEQVEDDHRIVQEIVERMKDIQAKTKTGRTNEELMQDREAVESAKRQIRALDARTHTRNKLRKAGMTLQLYKTRCELREEECVNKRAEALRGLEAPGGEKEENREKRVMGFGEYHRWAYGEVMKERPNYVANVAMESERTSVPRKLLQEWLQGRKCQWSHQRILEGGGNALSEPKTMLGERKIKRENEVEHWRESSLARFLTAPNFIPKQEEPKEQERQKGRRKNREGARNWRDNSFSRLTSRSNRRMPTVGEVFGFSIIPKSREAKQSEEDPPMSEVI